MHCVHGVGSDETLVMLDENDNLPALSPVPAPRASDFMPLPLPRPKLRLGYCQEPLPDGKRFVRCPNFQECQVTSNSKDIIAHVASTRCKKGCHTVFMNQLEATNRAHRERIANAA